MRSHVAPRTSLSKAQRDLIRSAPNMSPTAVAKLLGVSRGAVLRELGRVPPRTRKAAEFTGAVAAHTSPQRRPGFLDSWSLEKIRSARDAQARGDFCQAVRLAEILRTDDAMFVARFNRLAPQSSINALLEPSDDTARAKSAAARAATSVQVPQELLAVLQGTMVDHGIAIGYVEQETSEDGGRIDFRLTEWPLEFVKWNTCTERLETTVKNGGMRVPIVHGDGRWVVFKKYATLPWIQEAALLPAAMAWAAHAQGLADWAGASKSHGLAKIVGELPEGVSLIADDTGAFTPEAQAFLAMLAGIVSGENGVGIRPAGAKTDFLANGSTAWQVFSELIQNREKAAARIYLGTDAIMGAQGGAPGVDISMLFGVASTKVQGDLEAIESALSVGVYQPWAALNFGTSRYAPRLKYQIPDPDADKKSAENAGRRARLFDTLDRMKTLGMVIDQDTVDELSRELGVKPPPVLATSETKTVPLQLAPTDVAKVVRVREARAAQGLPPFGDARDDMTMPELEAAAKASAETATPPTPSAA